MTRWEEAKAATDQYLPRVKSILGCYLISEAPAEEDAQHNTDLWVLKLDGIRVGVRIRTFENYYFRYNYRNEFTVRSDLPSGTKTELAKILEGWGDYFFYGFGDTGGKLPAWVLLNLTVFRSWFHDYVATNGVEPGVEIPNKDGSSAFRAFTLGDCPESMTISRRIAPDTNGGVERTTTVLQPITAANYICHRQSTQADAPVQGSLF